VNEPFLITMRDIRAVHMCSRGTRAFCERHGLDYSELISNGLPVEVIEATGDAMALEVIEVARNGRK
jgi:hypothetical protein